MRKRTPPSFHKHYHTVFPPILFLASPLKSLPNSSDSIAPRGWRRNLLDKRLIAAKDPMACRARATRRFSRSDFPLNQDHDVRRSVRAICCRAPGRYTVPDTMGASPRLHGGGGSPFKPVNFKGIFDYQNNLPQRKRFSMTIKRTQPRGPNRGCDAGVPVFA